MGKAMVGDSVLHCDQAEESSRVPEEALEAVGCFSCSFFCVLAMFSWDVGDFGKDDG